MLDISKVPPAGVAQTASFLAPIFIGREESSRIVFRLTGFRAKFRAPLGPVIAASAKLKIGSLAELLKRAQASSTKFNWAATSGIPYFAFAGFAKSAGVDMVYVPYRDFNPALSDLGEGRIEVVSTALTQLLPHAQAGRAKFLALLNRTRTPLAAEVPTAAEVGYPDLAFDGVTGLFGGKDMPSNLRERIAADVRSAVNDPAVRDRLPPLGIVARPSTPAEFTAAIEEQRKKIAAIATAIGTKPQ